LLSFIGLITPHVARRLIGRDTAYLMPVSMTLGALLLAACDLMARTLFAPYELPVGVILSFVGAPFFLRLLIQRKRSNRHDAV
jgi:iron complex transport system permease protein